MNSHSSAAVSVYENEGSCLDDVLAMASRIQGSAFPVRDAERSPTRASRDGAVARDEVPTES